MRRWLPGVLVLGLLAACGSSSPSSSTTTTAAPSTTQAATATTVAPTIIPIPAADRSPVGTFGTAPTVTVPSDTPPTQLESADLIVGTGPAAKPGDNLTMQYAGYSYTNKAKFDASWDRPGQPFQFQLGAGQVIQGWDQGVAGMQVGGRRELIIPPSLGYGASPPGGAIAVNDTLIFIIDLVKIG